MTRFCPSALLLMLSVAGCYGPGVSEYEFTRFSMGTAVEYTVMARDRDSARTAVALAHEEMERVSRLLWEDDSLSVVFAINNATDSAAATPEALRFLARSRELANQTGGAFDPTIKPVVDLYDFDGNDPAPPSNDAIQSRLKSVGFSRFHVNNRGYVVKDTAAPPGLWPRDMPSTAR